MKRDLLKLIATSVVSVAVITVPALAQDAFDTDRDGVPSDDPFASGLDREVPFEDLDADRDGLLDDDEPDSGFLRRRDRDGIGTLDDDGVGPLDDDLGTRSGDIGDMGGGGTEFGDTGRLGGGGTEFGGGASRGGADGGLGR